MAAQSSTAPSPNTVTTLGRMSMALSIVLSGSGSDVASPGWTCRVRRMQLRYASTFLAGWITGT